MKIASSILAAMMAFVLMTASCTDDTPNFVVPGPGTGTGQTDNGDTPKSLTLKCDYIKENGLLGIMYWEYAGDTPEGELSNVLAKELYIINE